jgi:formylglycine-generating enzyme required for sulfatase activity
MKTHLIAIFFLWFSLLRTVSANNISISNVSITGQNVAAGVNNSANYSLIKFDVSWENSWRSSSLNWDAAWIFIKYRVNAGPWQHCNLNNTGHTAPSGSTIDAGLITPSSAFNITSNPAVGAFIYRSADGNGTVNYQNVYLRWNYGSQSVPDNAILDIQAFAIEMVYVPTGTFAVGDGATNGNQFTITTINTSNSTTTPSGSGSLGGQAGGLPSGQTAPTSSSWPNGFNAFYCMKYEISQGQYRDFLNTLQYSMQINRTIQSITSIGNMALVLGSNAQANNGIKVKTAGVASATPAVFGCDVNNNNLFEETNDGEWASCNFLSKLDVLSFLDWSGLRPMTEMEFEKSCRGILTPVTNEMAWGTSQMNVTSYTFANRGAHNEQITAGYSTQNGVGNSHYPTDGWPYTGPMRGGIFAGNSANSSRLTSGGTFFGIMELSGNTSEIVVSLYNSNGRAFLGTHGDGLLNSNGEKTNIDWEPDGIFGKGNVCCSDFYTSIQVSARFFNQANQARITINGGRGIRTAP